MKQCVATFAGFRELIKKTLKELSWHLHPGTRIYGLCLIFMVHAHCLIQIIKI